MYVLSVLINGEQFYTTSKGKWILNVSRDLQRAATYKRREEQLIRSIGFANRSLYDVDNYRYIYRYSRNNDLPDIIRLYEFKKVFINFI